MRKGIVVTGRLLASMSTITLEWKYLFAILDQGKKLLYTPIITPLIIQFNQPISYFADETI